MVRRRTAKESIMSNLENSNAEHEAANPVQLAGGSPSIKSDRRRRSKLQSEGAGTLASAAATAVSESNKKTTGTKSEIVLKKLRSAKGATIEQLMQATGWQAHSVRGFLSATVKKKLQLSLTSEAGKDRVRRYKIEDTASGADRHAQH
jgi:hypothetical protein